MLFFSLAKEGDPECWDQLCGDGWKDESEDGAVQDGGQIVKSSRRSMSSHGIFVSRLSLFNFCLINFGKQFQNVSNKLKFQSCIAKTRWQVLLETWWPITQILRGKRWLKEGVKGRGRGTQVLQTGLSFDPLNWVYCLYPLLEVISNLAAFFKSD